MFPKIVRNEEIAAISSSAISFIEIGGILGTLWCGWFSDAYMVSRSLICSVCSVAAGLCVPVLSTAETERLFEVACFLLGFFLYIPYSFSELIALESVDSRYTNFMISMNGLMSPLGSVFSGIPVNRMIERMGWKFLPRFLLYMFFTFTLLLWLNSIVRRVGKDSKEICGVCWNEQKRIWFLYRSLQRTATTRHPGASTGWDRVGCDRWSLRFKEPAS